MSHIFVPVLALLSALLLFVKVQSYARDFQAVFSEETQGHMFEIAQQVTLTLNDRISTNIRNVETIADSLSEKEDIGQAQIAATLNDMVQRYGYTNLLIANTDGTAFSNGGQLINVSRRKHYLRALQGESVISGVIRSDYNNTDSIEYAVPILKKGEVIGALIAGYELHDFKDILGINIFDGQGKVSLIDSQGVVIISDEKKDTYNFNRFLKDALTSEEYANYESDIADGKGGTLEHKDGDDAMMTYYHPLKTNDWYLLISTSTEQITKKTELFLRGMTYVSLAVATVITLLMLVLLLTQRKNRKQLETLLYVDPITEGRSFVSLELEAQKHITEKDIGKYVILQFNVEHFKLINTSFGREAGDQLLRYIYQTIQANLRNDELVARTDADRFCLLLQHHSPEATSGRLREISDAINRFNDGKVNKYLLRFDMGACIVDSAPVDVAMLYERANFSRTHGGAIQTRPGALSFYDEVERGVIIREKEIENRMEAALASREFEAYLQPKYGLENNKIAGAEALVRWNDPEKGLVSPADFIPLFERNGFIVKLDLYVFEEICELLQRRWENGLRCVPISVNLSRRHLEDPLFLEKYSDVYLKYSFPANLIEIELTESIVFDNMQQLIHVISEIHQAGFECSMDDFGSGYSSLNMLKDIPVDTLKLDRAFFYTESGDLEKSHHVVSSIIDLARKLRMKTVSEGIETIEQVEFLRKTRCDMVQGYVFAKPMPTDRFEEMLEKEER